MNQHSPFLLQSSYPNQSFVNTSVGINYLSRPFPKDPKSRAAIALARALITSPPLTQTCLSRESAPKRQLYRLQGRGNFCALLNCPFILATKKKRQPQSPTSLFSHSRRALASSLATKRRQQGASIGNTDSPPYSPTGSSLLQHPPSFALIKPSRTVAWYRRFLETPPSGRQISRSHRSGKSTPDLITFDTSLTFSERRAIRTST